MLVLPTRLLCWVLSTSDQDFVSFHSIICHPHTQIRTILFHDKQRDIPNLEFSPIHVSIGLSQIAFPIIVLPKDDRTNFTQEEQLCLPYWTVISAICVVVGESTCLDTPILECSIICEHPIFPFLVHHCFRCQNFHSLRHRHKLVNQIAVMKWIFTFSCNTVFMIMRYRISHTHSGGFIGFQNTRKFFVSFLFDAPLPQLFEILQCREGATDVSNFLCAFLDCSWIPDPRGRWNRFPSILMHFQGAAFPQPTFASPSA